MEDNRSLDAVRSASNQPIGQNVVSQAIVAEDALSSSSPERLSGPDRQLYEAPRRKVHVKRILISLGASLLLLLGGGAFFALHSNNAAQLKSGTFGTVQLPLGSVSSSTLNVDNAKTLKVNGQLQVANSIVLTPTARPSDPLAGQLYFDETSNQLAYFNGQKFLGLGGTSTATGTSTTNNITNVLGSTESSILLQSSAPGTQQSGGFNISGTGLLGKLQTSVVSSNGGTFYINPVSSTGQQQVAPGTPATVGLTSGSLTTGPGWANDASATKVTMGTVGGTAKSISVYSAGGSSSKHLQVGLYDDDGNVPSRPGSLLAQSAVVNLTPNGVTTVTIPSVSLSASTTYWLAVNTDDTTVERTYNGGSKASCFASHTFGSMTDPFGGCFFDDNNYTIYLNYTVGSGSTGSVSPAQFSLSATGQATFRNATDSTTAFQVQNSSGTLALFDVDTTNGRIGIGKSTPAYRLDVAGGDINVSGGHSLRFGGSQVISANSDGSTVTVSNLNSAGTISVQADNFVVQDANATHQNLAIDSNGGATFSNKTNSATGFQVQNASGQNLIGVDTLNGNVALQGRGTGTITVATDASSGISGSVSIKTGDSSTTASGDITIDSGSGIVDGTVITTKTFETGTNNLMAWFGDTIAQSSTLPRTGTYSLEVNPTGAFWGVLENNPSSFTVTPGHQYYYSFWVRAASDTDTIHTAISYSGTSSTTSLTAVTDSTTGWTQVSGSGIAPSGASEAYFEITSSDGTAGNLHYLDDFSVTDLSSASAWSTIRIGDTNAKAVNIGNLNQIQATTISSGSGVTIQSGASNITLNGNTLIKPQSNSTTALQLQNTSGSSLLTADTSNLKITIAGSGGSFASLILSNAHFASTQTTAPTIGTPTNCGTTPTAAVTAGSTDAAGSFTITTGTGGTSSTCDTTITFNQAYGAAPKSILVVGKSDAASAVRQIYVSTSDATSFTTSFGASAAGANSTTYSFNYWVVE